MTKGDFPALRMIVENGRLVPAGQFDAERLASYRRGAVVMCRFSEEKDRPLVRKWFAIIGLVLKTCETPWKNKDEAHEAIKLALGIVNLSKTVGGQFMQYPKSLTDLDDPEMTEALEQMVELLSRMTGVDVETLRKETAHADVVANTNTDDTPSSSVDAGASPASAETGDSSPPSPVSISLDPGLRTHLIDFARKASKTVQDEHLTDEAKAKSIDDMLLNYREVISEQEWGKLSTIKVSLQAVLAKKRSIDQARKFIAIDLLDCRPDEIGGAA